MQQNIHLICLSCVVKSCHCCHFGAQGFAVITSWLDLMKLFPLKYRNDKQPLKVAVDLLNHSINFLGLNGCCLETKQIVQEYW